MLQMLIVNGGIGSALSVELFAEFLKVHRMDFNFQGPA